MVVGCLRVGRRAKPFPIHCSTLFKLKKHGVLRHFCSGCRLTGFAVCLGSSGQLGVDEVFQVVRPSCRQSRADGHRDWQGSGAGRLLGHEQGVSMEVPSSAFQGRFLWTHSCPAPLLPYGVCPLTVLTLFDGKEVGELWHFLSWVHSCPRPSATFKVPSNNSEMGVGGLPTHHRVRRMSECQAKGSAISPFVLQMDQGGSLLFWLLPTKRSPLTPVKWSFLLLFTLTMIFFPLWFNFTINIE